MSKSLSMKLVNIKRRVKRRLLQEINKRLQLQHVDAVIKRDKRMIRRSLKGNGYATRFCLLHGLL